MANEDLKLNKVNLVSTQTVTTPVSSAVSSQGGVDNVFKSFEEFAKKQGVTLKKEDLFSSQNKSDIEKLVEEYIKNADENQLKELIDLVKTLPEEQKKAILDKIASSNPEFAKTLSQGESKEVSEPEVQPTPNPFGAKDESIQTSMQSLLSHGFGSTQKTETTAATAAPQQSDEPKPSASSLSGNYFASVLESSAAQNKDSLQDVEATAEMFANTDNGKQVTEDDFFASDDSVRASGDAETSADKENIRLIQLREKLERGNDGDSFDSNSYSKLSEKDKLEIYISEYAKNEFLYSGDEPKQLNEWINLSDSDKQKLIEAATVKVKQSLESSKNSKQKLNLGIEFSVSDSLDLRMQTLQAANTLLESLSTFKAHDSLEQGAIIAEMLDMKEKTCPENMSEVEKKTLKKANFIKDAMTEYAQKHGIADEICFDTIHNYATVKKGEKIDPSKKIPIGVAIQEKLANIPANEKTPEQKAAQDLLNAIPAGYLQEAGTKVGWPSALEEEMLHNKEYAEKLKNAKPDEKAAIKAEYFMKVYGDNTEKYQKFLEDAIKTLDVGEIHSLMGIARNLPSFQKALAQSEGDVQIVVSGNADTLGEHVAEFASNTGRLNPAQAKAMQEAVIQSASGKQMYDPNFVALFKNLSDGQLLRTYVKTAMSKNHSCPPEEADAFAKAVEATGNEDAIATMGVESSNVSKETQLIYGRVAARHKKALEAMINAETVSKYHKDNQVEGYDILQTNTQNLFPKDKAVELLSKLSDQISKCDVSNQTALHQIATSSIYEEVAVHAASNIYKYDESVQAKALEISYSTGNEKVIEAATLQVPQMAESAVKVMRTQIAVQVAAMEERHSAAIIDEFAIRQLKKELGFEADTSAPEFKSKLQAYIAELKKLPKSELYRRLCNDMQSWPSDMQAMFLESIVKYCPELFAMMLDKFGTKLLTNFGQLNIATKNAVLMQMLKTPTKRSDAIAYMKANPNGNYSDDLKKLFDEIMEDLVSSGMIVDDDISEKLEEQRFEAEHPNYSIQTSLPDIGYKYNWSMISDIDGNIGLVS